MKVLGIDVGGTSTKIGLVENGTIIKRWDVSTDIEDIFGNIHNHLSDVNWDEIELIGVSIPGFIEHKKNIVKLAGNLKLKDFDASAEFEKIFHKKAYVLNDANAAALGEFWQGAGRKANSMIMYTIGTGVGGGIIINGNLIDGEKGFAGELGHGGNFQNKYKCSCGLSGCIEPLSSATGIEKLLKENGIQGHIKDVAEKFKNGDDKIVKIFREALEPLSQHIVVMQLALNIETVVIGGGPSNIGVKFSDLINEMVREKQLDFISKDAKVVLAETKNDAGILGAAYWAIKQNRGEE